VVIWRQTLQLQEDLITTQRQQIQTFAVEINRILNHNLVALNNFEEKIRIIANISTDKGTGYPFRRRWFASRGSCDQHRRETAAHQSDAGDARADRFAAGGIGTYSMSRWLPFWGSSKGRRAFWHAPRPFVLPKAG
jgi:hypothetical protein